MPWNEPGNKNNNQDPWGSNRKQNPPDLDKIIGNFIRKVRELFTQKKNNAGGHSEQPSKIKEAGSFAGLMATVLFALWFLSGIFIVNPAEQAVILRWGQYTETLQPGLHWFARFIETRYMVDVQKIYSFSLQGDFLTKSSDLNDLPTQVVQLDNTKKSTGAVDQSKNLVNVE